MPLQPGEVRPQHPIADEFEPVVLHALFRALDDVEPHLEGGVGNFDTEGYTRRVVGTLRPMLKQLFLMGLAIGLMEAQEFISVPISKQDEDDDDVYATDLLFTQRDHFDAFLRRNGVNPTEEILQAFIQRDALATNFFANQVGAVMDTLPNEVKAVLTDIIQRRAEQAADPTQARQSAGDQAAEEEAASQVGLTRRMAQAVRNYYASRLEEVDQETAKAEAREYARRLKEQRARRIAQTEVMRALNSGSEAAWEVLADEGFIDRSTVVKEWVVIWDQRLCRICRPMDGKQRRLGSQFGPFRNGGFWKMRPPAHPNCRCSIDLKLDVQPGQVNKADGYDWVGGRLVWRPKVRA